MTRVRGVVRDLLGRRWVSAAARVTGYALIFLGFLLIIEDQAFTGIWVALLGWVVTRVARGSYNRARLEDLLGGLTARDAVDRDPASVPSTLVLDTLLGEDQQQRGGSGVYLVRDGTDVVGIVDVIDADRVPRGEWGTTRVSSVMRPIADLEGVAEDAPLLDIVARLERSRREAMPVLDPAAPERLVGLVTRERIHRLMRSRQARRAAARP
jgi:hypothetical protein